MCRTRRRSIRLFSTRTEDRMSRDRSVRLRHPATSFAVTSTGRSRVGDTMWGGGYVPYAFLNAAQRRFVASMIAFLPAALSLRFLRAGPVDEAAPVCFLDSAHLFRWAAAILARAAADILRLPGARAAASLALGVSIWRSSAM
jgi:hypothetical protein